MYTSTSWVQETEVEFLDHIANYPKRGFEQKESFMSGRRIILSMVVCTIVCLFVTSAAQAQGRMYNTAKQKLMEGKQIVGGTVTTSDPNIYCSMANSGFDYTWIEMQHSPLTYSDTAKMIWACRGALHAAEVSPIPRFGLDLTKNHQTSENTLLLAA